MQLIPELIRAILLDVEEHQPGYGPIQGLEYEDHPEWTWPIIVEHVYLLEQSGLIQASVIENECFAITRLTMAGHEFIANARNKTVWDKVVSEARSRGDSVSMTILNGLLAKAAERYFGL